MFFNLFFFLSASLPSVPITFLLMVQYALKMAAGFGHLSFFRVWSYFTSVVTQNSRIQAYVLIAGVYKV